MGQPIDGDYVGAYDNFVDSRNKKITHLAVGSVDTFKREKQFLSVDFK